MWGRISARLSPAQAANRFVTAAFDGQVDTFWWRDAKIFWVASYQNMGI